MFFWPRLHLLALRPESYEFYRHPPHVQLTLSNTTSFGGGLKSCLPSTPLTEPPLLRVSSDESVVHWGPKAAKSLFAHGFVRYSSAWAQLAEGRGDNVEEERAQSDWLQEFCLAFGLRTQERSLFAPETGFTRLTVGKQGSGGYPFSNRPLGWHTDGFEYLSACQKFCSALYFAGAGGW